VSGDDAQRDPAGPDLRRTVVAALGEGGALAVAVPGFTVREGQQSLAGTVAEAIDRRETLVAEAGTGTGKTYAYLVPLLLSGGRTLISTGTRHLQDQLHGRDLPTVRRALGLDVRTALLKGRANYVCHHHLQRHRSDGRFADRAIPDKLRRIERFAQSSVTGDRAEMTELAEDDPAWVLATSTRENCLGQDCPEHRRCFVMRARREAMNADVVVVNHHLFCADLALRDESVAELLPTVDAVVFDEAHQLPEVATEFFGESVSTRQLIDLSHDLLRAGLVEAPDGADWRALVARLERSARELRLAFGGRSGARAGIERIPLERLRAIAPLADALDDVVADLRSVSAIVANNAGRGLELDRCGLRATELGERTARWRDEVVRDDGQPAVGQSGAHPDADGTTADAVGSAPEASVVWAEVGAQYASLRRTPLSVAAAFSRHRAGTPRAWVFLSATLSMGEDFSHFVDALGLGDARCRRWQSPFDFANQAALWVPRGIGETSSAGFPARVADAAWPLVRANRGRAFFLCTTLRALREVSERLAELDRLHAAGLTLLVQGDAPRNELLRRFRSSSAPVLVGSAGFWEGVDVAGDALSLVVIDKLPFAPPDDPIVKARSDAMRRSGRDPFAHYQLPAAALALKQGAGRLIRSESDRGVLLVCDDRLIGRSYGRRLIASLPPFARVTDLDEALGYLPVPVPVPEPEPVSVPVPVPGTAPA
jgi:ATP-dependent DNA helicase DinG